MLFLENRSGPGRCIEHLGLQQKRVRTHTSPIGVVLTVQDAAGIPFRLVDFVKHFVRSHARPTPRLLISARTEHERIARIDLHLRVGAPWPDQARSASLLQILSR